MFPDTSPDADDAQTPEPPMLHTELDIAGGASDLLFSDPIKPTDSVFLSPPSAAFADLFLDRRMSTVSATSDSSSRTGGGDKRLLTPEDSPVGGAGFKRVPDGLDAPRSSVQLPSITQTFDDYRFAGLDRRMSLPTNVLERSSYPAALPMHPRSGYPSTSASPSPAYTFPPIDTNVSTLHPHEYASPYPTTASTPGGTYYGSSPMTPDPAYGHTYNGTLRISGQDHRRPSLASSSIGGSEPNVRDSWQFPPTPDYLATSAPPTMQLTPAPSSPPTRSPGSMPAIPPPGSLVERPPRKRGKLPKHVTDYLKEWLHHHSDHPYPSEEEKKQLCHTTGLSMSQVSNWMINARRRILAPAQRAASAAAAAAATANPYQGRAASHTGHLIAAGRRASMPTSSAADTMNLHYSGYVGVPYYGSGGSVDHMAGRIGPHRSNYVDPASYGHRYSYGGAPTSAGAAPAGHYLPSGMPSMSAPPLTPASPSGSYAQPVYAQSSPTSAGKYYNGATAAAPASADGAGTPGSNYDAPQ